MIDISEVFPALHDEYKDRSELVINGHIVITAIKYAGSYYRYNIQVNYKGKPSMFLYADSIKAIDDRTALVLYYQGLYIASIYL